VIVVVVGVRIGDSSSGRDADKDNMVRHYSSARCS
jgi:hypothetical protein